MNASYDPDASSPFNNRYRIIGDAQAHMESHGFSRCDGSTHRQVWVRRQSTSDGWETVTHADIVEAEGAGSWDVFVNRRVAEELFMSIVAA